jgi:hypothetical protein
MVGGQVAQPVVVNPPEQANLNPAYPQQIGGPADVQQAIQQNLAPQPEQPQIKTAPASAAHFAPPPTEKTVQMPKNSDQQTIDALNRAYGLQQSGIKAAADAGAEKAIKQQVVLDDQARLLNDRAKATQAAHDKASSGADAQMEKLKAIQDRLLNPTEEDKLDSNRVNPFTNGSTGQKIAAGIAVVLGGIGGALTGKGGNVGLDTINKLIDRDIDQQKHNIAQNQMRQKAGMEVSQNLLQDLHAQFQDSTQAEAALRNIMLEQAKNKLEALASKYQSPEIQAKAQQLRGQLGEEQAKTLHTFRQDAYQKEFMQQVMGSSAPGELPAQAVQMLPKEYKEAYVPGYGIAPNKERAEAFQKTRADLEPLTDQIRDVIKFAQSPEYSKVSPKERAVMATKINGLLGPMREKYGFKTMTEGDLKFLESSMGNPNKILTTNGIELSKLKELLKESEYKINKEAQMNGLRPKINNGFGFKAGGK